MNKKNMCFSKLRRTYFVPLAFACLIGSGSREWVGLDAINSVSTINRSLCDFVEKCLNLFEFYFESGIFVLSFFAGVAQLVERHLAKV
jgi:hypothetical protein